MIDGGLYRANATTPLAEPSEYDVTKQELDGLLRRAYEVLRWFEGQGDPRVTGVLQAIERVYLKDYSQPVESCRKSDDASVDEDVVCIGDRVRDRTLGIVVSRSAGTATGESMFFDVLWDPPLGYQNGRRAEHLEVVSGPKKKEKA